jgi:hypothetical protein
MKTLLVPCQRVLGLDLKGGSEPVDVLRELLSPLDMTCSSASEYLLGTREYNAAPKVVRRRCMKVQACDLESEKDNEFDCERCQNVADTGM